MEFQTFALATLSIVCHFYPSTEVYDMIYTQQSVCIIIIQLD